MSVQWEVYMSVLRKVEEMKDQLFKSGKNNEKLLNICIDLRGENNRLLNRIKMLKELLGEK